jgi:hypothetical protein
MDGLRPGRFLRLPDDASAGLVSHQPRPVAGAAGDATASRPFAPEPGLFYSDDVADPEIGSRTAPCRSLHPNRIHTP